MDQAGHQIISIKAAELARPNNSSCGQHEAGLPGRCGVVSGCIRVANKPFIFSRRSFIHSYVVVLLPFVYIY